MAKLFVLAVALAALVGFATAHTTIVTTTIDNGFQPPYYLPMSDLDVCQQYLQQSIQSSPYDQNYEPSQSLQQLCCQQLQNVDQQRQCDAVKQVFQDSLQGQQGGRLDAQQIRQLRQKAQQLPNQCNLQLRQQCQLGNIRTVITTVTEEDNRQSSHGSQQCSEVQGRQFNQCQRYIQQQQQQGGSLLMSINRRGSQQQPQELRSCCNELENVQSECQCEAMQQVYEQAMRQQQQGRRQSGRRAEMEPQMVQRAIQNLKNECNLQVPQQCRIPSAMF